jgi:hypothetical protein
MTTDGENNDDADVLDENPAVDAQRAIAARSRWADRARGGLSSGIQPETAVVAGFSG